MKMAKPEIVFENGSCKASVFMNEYERDGKTMKIPKTTISRRYLDKNDEWQTTMSFSLNDLPKVAMVAIRAYNHLTSNPAENQ